MSNQRNWIWKIIFSGAVNHNEVWWDTRIYESLVLTLHSEENNEYVKSLQESFQERNMIRLSKEGQIIGIGPFDWLGHCSAALTV